MKKSFGIVLSLAGLTGLASLASIAACGSGPDLAKTAPDVALIALTAPSNTNCFGCGYISGVTIGGTGVYLAYLTNTNGTPEPLLARLDFTNGAARGSLWTPTTAISGSNLDMAAAPDQTLFWAAESAVNANPGTSTDPNQSGILVYSAKESDFDGLTKTPPFADNLPVLVENNNGSGGGGGGDAGAGTGNVIDGGLEPAFDGGAVFGQSGSIEVAGIAADNDAVYVAYAQVDNASNTGPGGGNGGGPAPDSPGFPGTGAPSANYEPAAVARIARANPSAPAAGVTRFFLSPNIAVHMLAQNHDKVYFPDEGQSNNPEVSLRVLAENKSTFGTSAPTEIWSLLNPQGAIVVGITANDAYVAWSTSNFGSTAGAQVGCKIYASAHGGPATLLSGSTNGPADSACSGLAIDDTYAYVAITSMIAPQTGGGGSEEVTVGTGIARVPLAGGALQTVPLQSQKWYGPRRVFVDDTYVYAIDPGYVARFPKTDFPQ